MVKAPSGTMGDLSPEKLDKRHRQHRGRLPCQGADSRALGMGVPATSLRQPDGRALIMRRQPTPVTGAVLTVRCVARPERFELPTL